MEEINQSPQVAPQIPEQSSKKWWIKYLLTGIFGGASFAIAGGIFTTFLVPIWRMEEGTFGPNAVFSLNMLFFYLPAIWVIFCILTLRVGRRQAILLEEKPSWFLELLLLILGIGFGYWIIAGLTFFSPLLYYWLSFGGMGTTIIEKSEFWIIPLGFFFSGNLGIRVVFKVADFFKKRENFYSLIRRPFVWLFIVLFILSTLSFLFSFIQSSEMKSELNNLRLVDIRAQGIITPKVSSSDENIYKVVLTSKLSPPIPKYQYKLSYYLELKTSNKIDGNCPGGFPGSDLQIQSISGDPQLKFEFEPSWGTENPNLQGITCFYSFSYYFKLFVGNRLIRYSQEHNRDIMVVWERYP